MNITIQKKETSESFEAAEREKILYAGLRNGLALPYECATGTCGSCKATLRSGQLENLWPAAPGAQKLKTGRGEFLMCQNAARTDCEIAYRGKLEPIGEREMAPACFTGTILACEQLTPDVQKFFVALPTTMPFKGGQFVALSTPGLSGARAYSMVNSGADNEDLEFVIKRLPGGGFSEWLFAGNRDGAPVQLFGPLGRATLNEDDNKHLICIAGGSGIAGLLALLEQARRRQYFDKHKAHVFFGVRTRDDIFYRDKLDELVCATDGAIAVSLVFSEEQDVGDLASELAPLNAQCGFVTPVALRALKGRLSDSIAFVAGPPPMVDDALRELILTADMPPQDVRYDKFG